MQTTVMVASVGVIFRTFRKLSCSLKVCEGIFPRFGTMVALWVYIKPHKFGFKNSNSFCKNLKMAKIRNNARWGIGLWVVGNNYADAE